MLGGTGRGFIGDAVGGPDKIDPPCPKDDWGDGFCGFLTSIILGKS